MAVDYVKTGIPAPWDKKRHEPRYWPHFMEKRSKNSRHSNSALGRLYDMVKKEDFDVVEGYNLPFDKKIMKRFALSNQLDLLKRARKLKCQYDIAIRRVMAQLEIGTEFEVWTGFVMSRPRVGTAYKIQEKVSQEANALKKHFRNICIQEAGGRDSEVLGPFVAAMYQVTCEEVGIARHESRQPHMLPNGRVILRRISARTMPLISFPWLFAEVLGELAGGSAARRRGANSHVAHKSQETHVEAEAPGVGDSTEEEDIGEEDISQSYTRTSDGQVIHRGEILNLFHQDDESEDDHEEDENEEDDHGEEGPSLVDLGNAAGEEALATESTTAPDAPKTAEAIFQGTAQPDSMHIDADAQGDSSLSDTAEETSSCITSTPAVSVTDTSLELYSDSELEFEQDVIELPAESARERAARIFA